MSPFRAPFHRPLTEPLPRGVPMLDRIPAIVRHLLIVLAPPFLLAALVVLKAVIDAQGVLTAVDWAAVLWASILAAATWLSLVLTPLTRQYGVGKTVEGQVVARVDKRV